MPTLDSLHGLNHREITVSERNMGDALDADGRSISAMTLRYHQTPP